MGVLAVLLASIHPSARVVFMSLACLVLVLVLVFVLVLFLSPISLSCAPAYCRALSRGRATRPAVSVLRFKGHARLKDTRDEKTREARNVLGTPALSVALHAKVASEGDQKHTTTTGMRHLELATRGEASPGAARGGGGGGGGGARA